MIKKAVILSVILIYCICSAFSLPSQAYGYNDISFSALSNPSYFGSIDDAILNPAELSRVENDNLFYFTFIMSEAWDADIISRNERLYALQNLNTEMQFSFVGNSLSLTAIAQTWFSNRSSQNGIIDYDIYNRIGLQIDWSGSFDFFSLGLRIKGGGYMVRRDRNISGFINAIENAYFASFDNLDGSEYFDIGASLALNFEVFSISYYIDSLISFRNNELSFGVDEMLSSSMFGLSLRYPKFTARGDLNLIRPQIGFSVKGNYFDTSVITYNTALELQLLPTFSLNLAVAYREYEHRMFHYDAENGVLMFAFSVEGDNYAISLMCNVDTGEFRYIYPALSVTLSR